MIGGAAVVGVVLAFGLVGFLASRAAHQARDAAAGALAAPEAPVSDAPSPSPETLAERATLAGEPGGEKAAASGPLAAGAAATPAAAASGGDTPAPAPRPPSAPAESLPPDERVTAIPKPDAVPAAGPAEQGTQHTTGHG